MAANTVNDKRQAYLIAQIMIQEALGTFVGPKQLNDLEKRFADNAAAGLPEEPV